jgi:hypothetical protein
MSVDRRFGADSTAIVLRPILPVTAQTRVIHLPARWLRAKRSMVLTRVILGDWETRREYVIG